MLTEETLIIAVALGALGALVLGTIELLWPGRRRRAAGPHAMAAPTVSERRWRSDRPRHAAGEMRSSYQRRAPAEAAPAAARAPAPTTSSPPPPAPPRPTKLPVDEAVRAAFEEPPASSASRPVAKPVPSVPPPSAVRVPKGAVVERCFELYEAGRLVDAVTLGTEAVQPDAPVEARPADAQETAAVWSVLALAHQALGEHVDAREAIEAAIECAPESDRPTYARQMGALALAVAEAILARTASRRATDTQDGVAALREAFGWIERGLEVVPDDGALRALAADLQEQLWPAYERTVAALVQRQQFRPARRLLREALADPRFPAGRTAAFHELFTGTYSGEIGQLTAQAIRAVQEGREADAVTALQRAQQLLDSIHEEALPPKRREEVDRRLWWGYNKLGQRRVEAGQYEEALEALAHALRFAGSGSGRLDETRAQLAHAFHGLVDTRTLAIRELAHAGDREAALVQLDRLWTRLHAASDDGLAPEALAAPLSRVQRLAHEIGQVRP